MSQEGVKPTEYSEKQVRIIEAAERLFAAEGFDGTSVRDIAQEAGVNLAMINYYFGSKENLLTAVFAYRVSTGYLVLESLVNDKELSPVEKIHRMIDSYVDRMTLNQHFQKIVMREQVRHDPASPAVRFIKETKLRNLEMVQKLVTEGIRKKVFTKSVDVPLMMTTLIGTFYQMIGSQAFYQSIAGLDNMSDDEYLAHIKKRLKAHLKHLFIAALTYEVH